MTLRFRIRLRSLVIRLYSRLPWLLIWHIAMVIVQSEIGRRLLTQFVPPYVRKPLRQMVATVTHVCHSQKRTPRELQAELQRLYVNRLLVRILMFRLSRLGNTELEEWFPARGWEHLKNAMQLKRPVILLGSHFGVGRLFPLWISRKGIPVFSIEAQDELSVLGIPRPTSLTVRVTNDQFTARLTLEAHRHLQGGGFLHITGDNTHEGTQRSEPVCGLGMTRTYPGGFATLAHMTGACVIPYFCTLDKKGRVEVQFLPRILTCPGLKRQKPSDTEIANLRQPYVQAIEEAASLAPGNLCWPWVDDFRLP